MPLSSTPAWPRRRIVRMAGLTLGWQVDLVAGYRSASTRAFHARLAESLAIPYHDPQSVTVLGALPLAAQLAVPYTLPWTHPTMRRVA